MTYAVEIIQELNAGEAQTSGYDPRVGAGASLMQNIHAGFAAPNTCILELPPDYAGLHSEVIDGSLVLKDGHVLPPDPPGLGIVLTEETKRRYPFKPGSGEFNSVPGKF